MSIKIRIVSDFDKKGLSDAEKALGTLSKAAGLALAAVAAAVTGIAVKSVQEFSKFDAAMTQSQAIMGDLSDTMKKDMADAAREVAKATTFTAEEAGKSFFYLASAGLDAASSIAALPQVAGFAQAGMFDMATATDLLTDAQSALGLTIRDDAVANMENMVRVSDVLVRANTLANASVEQFSTSLTTKAGAALRSLGKDVEEGVAVLSAFADQGIKGEEAGTQLSIVLRDLQTKAIKNKDAFAEMGLSVFDSNGEMRNLGDIIANLEGVLGGMSDETKKATLLQLGFSDKSIGAMTALLGTSDAIKTYESELRSANGFTADVAGKQLETFSSQMKLLESAVTDVFLQIGEALTPALKDLLPKLQELLPIIGDKLVAALSNVDFARIVEDFGNFIVLIVDNLDSIGQLIGVISAVSAGLVIYTGVAKIAAITQGILNSTLLLSPWGLAAVALAGLTAAYVLNKDAISDTQKNVEILKTKTDEASYVQKGLADTYKESAWAADNYGVTTDDLTTAQSYLKDEAARVEYQVSTTAGEMNRFNNIKLSGISQEIAGVVSEMDRVDTTSLAGILKASGKSFTVTPTPKVGGGGGGKSQAEILKEQRDATQKVIQDAQKKLADSQKTYASAVSKIQKDNNDATLQIQKDYANRLESIIVQSQDRLRNVYKSAVEVNLATLFTQDESKSVTGLVKSLSDKLAASKALLSNSAELASNGFSQTFIEQIVSAGTETGNELAKAILESSPETQENLKSLFADLEKTANTGMDSLAAQIYEKQGFATAELQKLYKDTEDELVGALAVQQATYANALETAATTLYDSIVNIREDFNKEIDQMAGKLGGLDATLAAFQARLDTSLTTAGTAAMEAATMPGGSATSNAVTTAAKDVQNATGILIDSVDDIAGVYDYLGQRVAGAQKYLASSNLTEAQRLSATSTLQELQGAQASIYNTVKTDQNALVGTVININVKADTSQSLAMVGKSLGNTVAKYVTGGGQVIVSPV